MTRSMDATTIRVNVYVQPGASRAAVAGMHDGCLKIRVAAPAIDGAANAALIELVADRLGVAKSRVRIVAGQGTRRKVLEIEDVTVEAFNAAMI